MSSASAILQQIRTRSQLPKVRPVEQIYDSFAEIKSPPAVLTKDILAVSAKLWRTHGFDRFLQYSNLLEACRHVTPEPHDLNVAEDIRLHFAGVIVAATLREQELTKFQRTLAEYLTTPMKYTSDYQGMLWRLPEYYYSDIKLREMYYENFYDKDYVDAPVGISTRKLYPITKVFIQTKIESVMNYWLKDDITGNPVLLVGDYKSQFRYIWEELYEVASLQNKPLYVESLYHTKTHPLNFQYMKAIKWKVSIDYVQLCNNLLANS